MFELFCSTPPEIMLRAAQRALEKTSSSKGNDLDLWPKPADQLRQTNPECARNLWDLKTT